METEYKIALAIKTEGLEYDDRVRKEILSIKKLYPNIEFKIFAMLPDNKEYEGVTSYGVPFKAIYLKSRDKYPSAKKVLKKTYEFYKVLKDDLKKFDAVWCGDYHSVAIALLCRYKPVLWDLHELPSMLLGNGIKQFILKKTFDNCKVVVHANPQRIDYLKSCGCITAPQKHYALRNYPNFEDVDKEYDEKYHAFVEWKAERHCVYLQGLTNYSRADKESIEAVLTFPDLVAVVVGGFQPEVRKELEEKYGQEELKKRVYFVGKIPQLKIPQYVAQCFTTLVFYKNVRPNNYYCEANRFYQAVILGLPVVVGNNPPMKDLVEEYNLGVVANTDGCSVDAIYMALNQVIHSRVMYLESIQKNKNFLIWDQQESVIKQIVDKLIDAKK